MGRRNRTLIVAVACALLRAGGARAEVVPVSTAAELQAALAHPRTGVVVKLAPGDYHLIPTAATDPTCGNCQDPHQPVPVTVGLRVSGRRVFLYGPEHGRAVIHTHAGYGVLFDKCDTCMVQDVTITGGERDTAAAAADAAVVVRDGRVIITRCHIQDNIGAADVVRKNVVGIMGICGREGARMSIVENDIVHNSWDGIALYRDAQAEIKNNLIDGVDKATGKTVGGGRGVAVGVTWNARALVVNNVLRRYWKGLGVFVDAAVTADHNIVEDMVTWGIAFWDAGKGTPRARLTDNVVFDCGACGISVTRRAPLERDEQPQSEVVDNVVARTGQNPKYDDPEYYCQQCALALETVPAGLPVTGNVFFDNRRASDDLFNEDVSEIEFRLATRGLVAKLGPMRAGDGRRAFEVSTFLHEFGTDDGK